MKRSYIIRGLAFFAAALLLQACFVAKDYSRPEVLSNNSSYRTDLVSRDSSSLANLSWRELFQDTILRGYIEKALENNTDIRIAIQQISIAQSYYLQGKAGYLDRKSVV